MTIEHALRNLRHLYEQMLVPGMVFDTPQAARGLLGPAIIGVEQFTNDHAALLTRVAALEADLLEVLNGYEEVSQENLLDPGWKRVAEIRIKHFGESERTTKLLAKIDFAHRR